MLISNKVSKRDAGWNCFPFNYQRKHGANRYITNRRTLTGHNEPLPFSYKIQLNKQNVTMPVTKLARLIFNNNNKLQQQTA